MRKYIDEFPTLTGFEWDQAMVDAGHNTTAHLRERGGCPKCTKLLKKARDRRYGIKQRGWVPYPVPADSNGNLVVHLGLILSLVGTLEYESRKEPEGFYIRRLEV